MQRHSGHMDFPGLRMVLPNVDVVGSVNKTAHSEIYPPTKRQLPVITEEL